MRMLLLVVVGLFLLGATAAFAGNTATQTVTYEVSAINEISVSGNPGALTVSTSTAGSAPNLVSDNSTTYNVTTNGTGKKITGAINTNMPANVTLQINLVAPTGGSSTGDTTLSSDAADLVTGITKLSEGTLGITYKLSATAAAGIVGSATKTVTLTLTDGA